MQPEGGGDSGSASVQMLSVPPSQLAQHATANGCSVAALLPGELRLPPGASYEQTVEALVAAVERQYRGQQLARG